MTPAPHRALAFVALTYTLTAALAYGFFALVAAPDAVSMTAMAVAYMFMPGAAALILQKGIFREPVMGPLRVRAVPNVWFLVAWAMPPLIGIATLGVSLLFPHISWSWGMEGMFQRYGHLMSREQIELARSQIAWLPVHPFWVTLMAGMAAGATVNAVAGLGEELGWRGFLLRQLEGYGFWAASLVTGAIWGLWHAPLVLRGHNYPEHPVAGVGMMVVWCMLLSPPMTYITLRARSVLAAALFHGTLNGTAGLAVIVIAGGDDLTSGVTGLPGFIVLAAVNVSLVGLQRWRPALTAVTSAAPPRTAADR